MVYSLFEAERALVDKLASNVVLARVSCGALAGITAKTCIAPFELLKMRFQVSSEPFSYRSMFSKLKCTLNNDGVLALWRGHSANVIRVAPYAAFHYTIHDMTELYLTGLENNYISRNQPYSKSELAPRGPSKSKSHWVQFFSGAAAGAGTTRFILCHTNAILLCMYCAQISMYAYYLLGATSLTYPLDVLRARVATMRHKDSWRVAAGARGFFHGFVPTLLGTAICTEWLFSGVMCVLYLILLWCCRYYSVFRHCMDSKNESTACGTITYRTFLNSHTDVFNQCHCWVCIFLSL